MKSAQWNWVRTFVLGLTVLWLSACHLTTASSVSDREVLPLNHLPAISGDYFELDSRAVGRPFHIYVSLPEGYQTDRNVRYPVVYVLDGDSLFPILAANHLFLNYDENLPKAIVVGIAYGLFDPGRSRP